MADRGFDVNDSVGLMATIKMSAFTKGKTQMPAIELEQSRKLAHLQIHVEHVICLLHQKYTFLGETVPIASVCCALSNLKGPIVPFD